MIYFWSIFYFGFLQCLPFKAVIHEKEKNIYLIYIYTYLYIAKNIPLETSFVGFPFLSLNNVLDRIYSYPFTYEY